MTPLLMQHVVYWVVVTITCSILFSHLKDTASGNNTHVPTVGSSHNVSTVWLEDSHEYNL